MNKVRWGALQWIVSIYLFCTYENSPMCFIFGKGQTILSSGGKISITALPPTKIFILTLHLNNPPLITYASSVSYGSQSYLLKLKNHNTPKQIPMDKPKDLWRTNKFETIQEYPQCLTGL